jgi:multidrug efflux system membrane fusion protein
VPAAVVQRGQQGTYAYVIGTDGKAQMRAIDVTQIQDGKAVIGKGLAENETVVLDGQYKIKPGTAVVAQATQATQATQAMGAQPERKTE